MKKYSLKRRVACHTNFTVIYWLLGQKGSVWTISKMRPIDCKCHFTRIPFHFINVFSKNFYRIFYRLRPHQSRIPRRIARSSNEVKLTRAVSAYSERKRYLHMSFFQSKKSYRKEKYCCDGDPGGGNTPREIFISLSRKFIPRRVRCANIPFLTRRKY